jgi:hypothetical protein
MVGRYFRVFGCLFFEHASDFWKCFVDTFTAIFKCDFQAVLSVLDYYGRLLLYDRAEPSPVDPAFTFRMSESITTFVESSNILRIEKELTPVPLCVGPDNVVRAAAPIEDGQFIADLAGFLMHTDEIEADDGIPLTCLSVTDTYLVVDLDGSAFDFTPNLARSFHFNTIVKMYRLVDELRVGLFATRVKGPILEEKGKRGVAIGADQPLFLPFDGEIPYPVPKVDWKERKTKPKLPAKPKPQANPAAKNAEKKKQPKPKKIECPVTLSLLSAFCHDIIPPIPIILLTEKECQERMRRETTRARMKAHRLKIYDV